MGDIVRHARKGKFVGWYVRYIDSDGTRRQRASHQPTRELARRYLLEIEGRIARGQLGIPEPPPRAPTVAELCERFLVEYTRPRIKDLAKYRQWAASALARVCKYIGSQVSTSLQPVDLDRLRETLSRHYAAGSVRVTLDHLGTVFSWAVRAKIVEANPVKGIEKPIAASSVEYLRKVDVRALLALTEQRAAGGGVAERAQYVAVFLVLHTGLRKGELLGLRWRDLDIDARRLTVARSFTTTPKSGKARHLRLPAEVVPVLEAWQRECPRTDEGVVIPCWLPRFAQPRMGCKDDLLGLPELLADIGCGPLLHPWHALRHTFASHFVMSGGNILALQKILGHADISQTMVYAHLGDEYLATEIDRLKF